MEIQKIEGIRTVDLKIKASGFGVVNWNGSMPLFNKQISKTVNNHRVPKLMNFDMFKRRENEDGSASYTRSFDDKELLNSKIFVSQNCIKSHLFKDESFGLQKVTNDNVLNVIPSMIGLVRGYVIAEGSSSFKRKSPLLLEDFLTDFDGAKENNGSIAFEQFANKGERNETSIFSEHNVKEVEYLGYASINIEDLQFLPLENYFDRSCYKNSLTKEDGENVAKLITNRLKSYTYLNEYKNLNPIATFETNYVRKNSIDKIGEAGVLLNNDALTIVVKEIIQMFKDLSINQGGGWLKIDDVTVDYNNSKNLMRIKNNHEINSEMNDEFAIYYQNIEISEKEFNKKSENSTKSKKKEG